MDNLTPAQLAKLDQIESKIRDYVLELVTLFQAATTEKDVNYARAALMMGLMLGPKDKVISVAIMAISLLAEKES